MKTILVEGKTDKIIVSSLLKKFGMENRFRIESTHGRMHLRNYTSHTKSVHPEVVAVLLDSDNLGLKEAKEIRQKELNLHIDEGVRVFIVVPEIESWLLADKDNLIRYCSSDDTKLAIERITIPESVIYPRMLISNVFGNLRNAALSYQELVSTMNIQKAISSSHTLRDFYYGLLEILENPKDHPLSDFSSHNYTDIESRNYKTLLLESSNMDQIAFRTLKGEKFTYRDLVDEIDSNSDVGKEYVFNLLRAARDILSYQARKGDSKEGNKK